MTTILSQDEILHRAVLWISEQRKANPQVNMVQLVQQASARFELPPSAEEWLLETFGRAHPTA
jgi:hypothetical protein